MALRAMQDWIDLFNSKFAFVAVIVFNTVFTMYWVHEYAPWKSDERMVNNTLSRIVTVTEELTLIVQRLNIKDTEQSIHILELDRRVQKNEQKLEHTR